MTNTELSIKFMEIAAGNPFDAYIALKSFNKEYKKSDFYKATHLSCWKAYEYFNKTLIPQLYFKLNSILSVEGIAGKITDVLDSLDQTTVDAFFDKVLNTIGSIDLQQEKGEAKILISQLKDTLK